MVTASEGRQGSHHRKVASKIIYTGKLWVWWVNPISLNNMEVLPRIYPNINLKIPHTFAPTHMKTRMHTHKHENGKRQKRRGKTYWIPTTYTLCKDTEMVITWSLLAQKFISLITFKFKNTVCNVFVAVYKILNKYKQPLL